MKKETKEEQRGTPDAGTRSPAGKMNPAGEGEAFKYRFSTATPVTEAKFQEGVREKCFKQQEGLNLSKLPKDTSPGGDLKDGSSETYEKTVIGVP